AIRSAAGDTVSVLYAKGQDGMRTYRTDWWTLRLLFSPDGRYLVGKGPVISHVWDLSAPADTGPVARLPTARSTGFSSDGKMLAFDDEGGLSLWKTGEWKATPLSADPGSRVHRV